MSTNDEEDLKPLRHRWSINLAHKDFYIDEPISGHVELLVQDVYMAAKIELTFTQYITVVVSDKYVEGRHVQEEFS